MFENVWKQQQKKIIVFTEHFPQACNALNIHTLPSIDEDEN